MSKTPKKLAAVKGPFSACTPTFDIGARLVESISRNDRLKRVRVVEALRAGLLALVAKDTLAHGDFERWWAEKRENVSHLTKTQAHNVARSLRNYMRLASAFLRDLQHLQAKDFMAAPFLAESVTEANEEGFADRCRIFAAAVDWIADRSLCEIYTKEGVLKADTDHGQHNAPKLSPAQRQQLEFKQFCDGWKSLTGTVATQMKAGMIAKLPAELRWGFVAAAVPALEHIAATTADLTPDQLKALEQQLVSISGTIRERLRTTTGKKHAA